MATRIRRGQTVPIPPQWLGKVTTPQTIRNRSSKLSGKVKRQVKDYAGVNRYKDRKDFLVADE